ncbi:MAG: DUF4276 family protein [Phycisphaerae bacterium]
MKRWEIASARRIVLLCEGDTEEHCVKHFLRRLFDNEGLKSVGLHPVNLGGHLEDVFEYVPRYRRDHRVIGVFTLIDLYGMSRVTHSYQDTLDKKVERVREWLRNGVLDVADDFFHPHVCVHEIEAWFLAEGEALRRRLRATRLDPLDNAEELDFDNPPKNRVTLLFRQHLGRRYEENNDGQPLFKALAHSALYERCRYYREFYDDLLAHARSDRL